MNFFKSEWIVLSIKKINEKEILYKIFFREYGKVIVKKQRKTREKSLDIWYRISCEVITYSGSKNIFPSIWNIKILSYFKIEWKKYSDIEWYLKTIAYLDKQVPEWLPHIDIYDIMCSLHMYDSLQQISYLLIRIKILSYSWDIDIWESEITLHKVICFIERNSIDQILRLQKIPADIEKKLELML